MYKHMYIELMIDVNIYVHAYKHIQSITAYPPTVDLKDKENFSNYQQ
jgi:hypothetical protein